MHRQVALRQGAGAGCRRTSARAAASAAASGSQGIAGATCSAAARQQGQAATAAADASRRLALLSQASLLAGWAVAAGPAAAVCADQTTEAAGDACRAAELAKDAAAELAKASDYRAISGGGAKKATAPNVPVSTLDSEYGRATRDLAAKIEQYMTTDVYDKSRQPLIKSLKGDGAAWVSKYARGGSARSQSARTMYVAVDAVQGFLASNGLAPFPAGKARVVEDNLAKALAFLEHGK